VHRAIAGAEIVVNLVGVLSENRAASFQAVHTDGAERIARMAAATGVHRLIHISAIGADPNSASRYGATKGNAEQAVTAAFPAATILRPSIVFGAEDKFFNRFAALARIAPFMPVISGATKMQSVFVGDVADAVMAALATDTSMGLVYEIGGPRVWTFREILAFILQQTRRDKRLVDIPMGIARLQARILEHVPGKPLTPDQLLMLSKDNVVSPSALGLADLGVTPTPAELVVPSYLSRYQPGGGRRPSLPLTGRLGAVFAAFQPVSEYTDVRSGALGFSLHLGPGVPQPHRAVEHRLPRRRVRIEGEVPCPLELHGLADRAVRQ
jgi:uncharacterized protein YbjT (DUF2867 family)